MGKRARPADDTDRSFKVRRLRTEADRAEIMDLRKHCACASEYELDPGLAEVEALKDEIGLVYAIYFESKPIATIRFVPTDRGVTLTERLWRDEVLDPELFGPHSLEVGRLVLAPEHRNPDTLFKCMGLALRELIHLGYVEHLHASCLKGMTRLYRRMGFATLATLQTKSGKECALIHGSIAQVASAFKMPTELRACSDFGFSFAIGKSLRAQADPLSHPVHAPGAVSHGALLTSAQGSRARFWH